MDNEDLLKIKKDSTEFVDELKDTIHEQCERLKDKDKVINQLLKKVSELEYEEERLNNKLKEIDNLVEEVNEAPLVEEDKFIEFYDKYYELKDSDKE